MNEKAFGAAIRGAAYILHNELCHQGPPDTCQRIGCTQIRTDVLNMRALLEAAEGYRSSIAQGLPITCHIVEKLREKMFDAIAACRAETGKNQNA